jgi:predicted RNase H-like HicB family nuclease
LKTPAVIKDKLKVSLRLDEDGVWIAKSDALAGCHAHGKTRAEAMRNWAEAAKAHLVALRETHRPLPVLSR